MAGFNLSAGPNDEAAEVRDEAVERFNARLGLVLFAVYLTGYAAYMLVNTLWPSLMDEVPFLGVNLAVSSGMALIVGAIALSLVYALLCRVPKRGQP